MKELFIKEVYKCKCISITKQIKLYNFNANVLFMNKTTKLFFIYYFL